MDHTNTCKAEKEAVLWSYQNFQGRPRYTGWFASFESLEKTQKEVDYAPDFHRMMGSTMDFTAIYRLHSILHLFVDKLVSPNLVRKHVLSLQEEFLKVIEKLDHPVLNSEALMIKDPSKRANFLAFVVLVIVRLQILQALLKTQRIHTDYRGDRIRFGFGMQTRASDILEFEKRIHKVLAS